LVLKVRSTALDRTEDHPLEQVGEHRHSDGNEPILYLTYEGLVKSLRRAVGHVSLSMKASPSAIGTETISTASSIRA